MGDPVIFGGVLFVSAIGLLCLFIFGVLYTELGPKIRRALLISGVFLLSLGWLIGPWVAFGLWTVGAWNIGRINYLNRPPEVIPTPREVIDAGGAKKVEP